MVTGKVPLTLPIVANTDAVPGATPVTAPVDDTVATVVSDDIQVVVLVTSLVEPSESVSVARNCDVDPTGGATPVIVTAVALDGAVVLPHAAANTATPHRRTSIVMNRNRMRTSSES